MARVILLCGALGSGKSTYARRLAQRRAVLLSADEIMLAVFGQDAGADHDRYTARVLAFLHEKAAALAADGLDVILDIGLWSSAERQQVRAFYAERGIPCAVHYIDTPAPLRRTRIEQRNRAIREHGAPGYLVDAGLLAKAEGLFQPPAPEEYDVRITPGTEPPELTAQAIGIRRAAPDEWQTVAEITAQTIRSVYPHYYPAGAVAFFLAHHSDDHIRADLAEGCVYFALADGRPAGTVTINGNEINRLFVLPAYQGRGLGRALLDFAEQEIFRTCAEITLSASLPAKAIYQKRGYHSAGWDCIPAENGDLLCFDTMVKYRT